MQPVEGLPEKVVELIGSAITTQFASVSKEGLPIDTPLLVFPEEDMSTINVATGLAYPAKAERARRNPKVGLLIEGRPDEPVISIAGMAALRDSDIQANALRYLAQVGAYGSSVVHPWDIARKAVWYWSRIIIEVTPKRILWWDNPAAMDAEPYRWEAPAGTIYPPSDPAPTGKGSAAPNWPEVSWRDYAQSFLSRNARGHLTLLDSEAYPLPMPVRSASLEDDCFHLDLPLGVPWTEPGLATFTYEGRATFVGRTTGSGASATLRVERMLPVLPLAKNGDQVWLPDPDVKEALMERLGRELGRRGQTIPTIPERKPEPTSGALRRKARFDARAPGR